MASVRGAIGQAYIFKQDFNKALENYTISLELTKKQKNEFALANLYTYYADYYLRIKQFNKAIEYSEEAIKIASEINAPLLLKNSYQFMMEAYSGKKDYKNSLHYATLYYETGNQLVNEEKSKQITRIVMQSEFEKKQDALRFEQAKKDIENKAKLQRQKYYTYGAFVGLALIVGVLFLILKNSQQRKKANLVLTEKNALITEKNNLLELQKEEISHKNKQITDSIVYAKRIQNAVLPPEDFFRQLHFETFILYKPKDIVSGDFYWISNKENKTIVVVADCTGHGVPGAFMSMLGISLLNELAANLYLKEQTFDAAYILNELRNNLKQALHQTGKRDETKDGMDLSCLVLEKNAEKVDFAGAYNTAYRVRKGELTEYKADKMPIAIHFRDGETFTNHEIDIEKGDMIYMCSDGYVDQFGGPDKKKFLVKNFRNLLTQISALPIDEQQSKLDHTLETWMSYTDAKGNEFEQIDDITVLGIRL
jgi:serine phosphatase RsbU (regulator of sigma subunit)